MQGSWQRKSLLSTASHLISSWDWGIIKILFSDWRNLKTSCARDPLCEAHSLGSLVSHNLKYWMWAYQTLHEPSRPTLRSLRHQDTRQLRKILIDYNQATQSLFKTCCLIQLFFILNPRLTKDFFLAKHLPFVQDTFTCTPQVERSFELVVQFGPFGEDKNDTKTTTKLLVTINKHKSQLVFPSSLFICSCSKVLIRLRQIFSTKTALSSWCGLYEDACRWRPFCEDQNNTPEWSIKTKKDTKGGIPVWPKKKKTLTICELKHAARWRNWCSSATNEAPENNPNPPQHVMAGLNRKKRKHKTNCWSEWCPSFTASQQNTSLLENTRRVKCYAFLMWFQVTFGNYPGGWNFILGKEVKLLCGTEITGVF